jgi:ribosomal protein S18 acetylase RimI-like enzyme
MLAVSVAAFAKPPWNGSCKPNRKIQELLDHPSCDFIGCYRKEDGNLLGCAVTAKTSVAVQDLVKIPSSIGVSVDDIHLTWLAVEPRFWGNGIGRRLLAEQLDIAASYAPNMIVTSTLSSNQRMLSLLTEQGFRIANKTLQLTTDGMMSTLHLIKHR